MGRTYMAVDGQGRTEHDLGAHPRKTLLARLGRRHADKMYHDTPKGTEHIGYVIGGRWWTLFKVEPFTGRA